MRHLMTKLEELDIGSMTDMRYQFSLVLPT